MTRPLGAALESFDRRRHGTFVVDEWGCDAELLDAIGHLGALRWDVSIGGAAHIPAVGPAVLVTNTRPLGATTLLIALALHRHTGRAVRFVGIPDLAPLGPGLRRIGGALARPDEVDGLLRAGHLVALPSGSSLRQPGRVGTVSPLLLAPALELGAPVLPVAALSRPTSRRARVEVGPPVYRPETRGPLAEVEITEEARGGVQRLLDEVTPPRWMLGG